MNLRDLQADLQAKNFYTAGLDGRWGPATSAAIMAMFGSGNHAPLDDDDLISAADRLGVSHAQIVAVTSVESDGAGFEEGLPSILAEPHVFSRLTAHKYDTAYPTISYSIWGTRPYPPTQAARYQMLLNMIRLDVDAGFSSASYGKFQIMGSNYAACGFASPSAFAEAMAAGEQAQLLAFENFLRANHLVDKLAACTTDPATCLPFALAYNGPSAQQNDYHGKLAKALAS